MIKSAVLAIYNCNWLYILAFSILPLFGFSQDNEYWKDYLHLIPYDSALAKEDISKGNIRILSIGCDYCSIGTSVLDFLTEEQLSQIQDSIGFYYDHIYIEETVPRLSVDNREKEYNGIVYRYLDSIHQTNSAKLIQSKIVSIYRKNRNQCFMDFHIQESDTVQLYPDNHKKVGSILNSESYIEIRYYNRPSLVNGGDISIIKCQDGLLSADRIDYWYKTKSNGRKIKKVKKEKLKTYQVPHFIDSLKSLGFFELPTMDDIRYKMKKSIIWKDGREVEVKTSILDGTYHTFQIKFGDNVRTIEYHSPSAWYQSYNDVKELKLADDIIKYFQSTLNEKMK